MQSKLCFLGQHDTKNNEFKLHTHNCYEIIFFASGKGSIFIDNKTFPVTPFSYCIIPPHTEHTEILENNSKIQFIGFKFNCPKQKACRCVLPPTFNRSIRYRYAKNHGSIQRVWNRALYRNIR